MWLETVGMYHYKARIYSPTLGRFLQTDPIGYEDQINLYAYVGNDPVNSVDPSGMCTGSRIGIDASGCKTVFDSSAEGSSPAQAGRGKSVGGTGRGSGRLEALGGSDASVEAGGEIVVTRHSGCWLICRIVRVLGIRSTGLSGESAVRDQFDIGPKARIEVDGKARYPDGLNNLLGTISEVKNTSRLSMSGQMRAYLAYSQETGFKFNLYFRVKTELSLPLAELGASGAINIVRVPGM